MKRGRKRTNVGDAEGRVRVSFLLMDGNACVKGNMTRSIFIDGSVGALYAEYLALKGIEEQREESGG